jgi:hypothetical protein
MSATHLAKHDLSTASPCELRAEDILCFAREPLPEEISQLRGEFEGLSPRERYRGKFALLFFRSWLRLLHEEFTERKLDVFAGLDTASRARVAELSGLAALANRSALPIGLTEFASQIT